MQKIILIALLLYSYTSMAQIFNYVPNPSFEERGNFCPSGFDGIDHYNWDYSLGRLKYWYQPTNSTTDYYHACSGDNYFQVPNNYYGSQEAKEGNAYIGLLVYSLRQESINQGIIEYREYANTKLLKPLEAGKTYCVSFYAAVAYDDYAVSGGDNTLTFFSTKSLGANLSKTLDTLYMPLKYGLIPVTPPLEPHPIQTQLRAILLPKYLPQILPSQ
jgi:hypothetical protein